MKFTAHTLKYIHITLVCLVWVLAIFSAPNVLFSKSTPIFKQIIINDGTGKTTPLLSPGDSVRQSFQLNASYLESVGLAFSYENSALESGNMRIQFYHGTDLIADQPLILAACPQRTFLSFHLGLEHCDQNKLTIQITNTSEDMAGTFSVLSTANPYDYLDYSEGYLFNDSKTQDGSILCSFNFRTGRNYYIGLTYVFFILLGALAFTKLIAAGCAWLRRHKCH